MRSIAPPAVIERFAFRHRLNPANHVQVQYRSVIEEVTMSLLQKIDVYHGRGEEAVRRRAEYGFVLVLICVVLALVAVNAFFGSAPSEVPLVGP